MIRNIYSILVSLLIGHSAIAKEKTISSFIKKYNLPSDVNILSVFEEDCVNCYYGFSFFLKDHAKDFKKEDFVFLFQKKAENEIDNIFKYRLELDKTGCRIIADDDFYKKINTKGVTTLSIIKNSKVEQQYISNTIHTFKGFTSTASKSEIYELIEKDTIDFRSRFGTKKVSIDILSMSKIVIQNIYTNDIYLFDINSKTIKKKLSFFEILSKYDSLLKILIPDNLENLNYNLSHYKTNEYYKTFPLCKIKKIDCINNTIYIGLSVSRMVPDKDNHISYESLQALVKIDTNLQIQQVYKLPERITNSDKNISFSDCIFINSDSVVLSLSVGGDRKKDSICALYSLTTKQTYILNLNHESFMPLKGSNGYYNYYHFDVWWDKNSIKANFKQSPYIYNLTDNTKKLIPEIGIDQNSIDIVGKDKFFWISKVFSYQNSMLIIGNQKQNEMSLYQYDKAFEKLISKKKIFKGYLSDIFLVQNKVYAFEDYSQNGDVAILHIYELK